MAALERVDVLAEHKTFPLVAGGKAAPICIPPGVEKVVRIAAEDLAEDIESITGIRPDVRDSAPADGPSIQVSLSATAKGHWETFRLSATVDTLHIEGSDKRALAFGIYDVSRRIGVSPWKWWADVPVPHHKELHLSTGTGPVEAPAVRYRGIFLNDEGWGLRPWAAKTYEPEVGNIGPKTYGRIFELLLRLRANTIWPAMHPGTTPFHLVPGNAKTADDYAIVVGSSHAEPMLRNNVGEWKGDKNLYNYLKNRDGVLCYWEERVKERVNGESLFTLGMRGIHDGPIVGPKSQKECVSTLQSIFAEQRKLLARHLGDPADIGQIFCPYKEVLDIYNAGLQVPDDAIIVWPDDNYGYIRRFAKAAERERRGGLGIYYHASYLGLPQAWLWIDTMPPALIWSEMRRAYEQGARSLWIVNVGDLKNTERSTECFLDLAWNADRAADPQYSVRFVRETAARDFGDSNADAIADVLRRLHAINFARKTEHLQWHLSETGYQPTELNETEINERLKACAALLRDCETIATSLDANSRDAWFQLVGYPVGITAAANEHYFHMELARADVARGRSAGTNIAAASAADERIEQLINHYNNDIAGGKWRNIATRNGVAKGEWQRYQPAANTSRPEPTETNVCPQSPPATGELVKPLGAKPGDFIERDGVVSIHAGHFSSQTNLPSGAGWRAVPGLGRTGNAVTVLPSTADLSSRKVARLSYRFYVASGGKTTLRVRLLPTFPVTSGQGLRLGFTLDDGASQSVQIKEGFDTKYSPQSMTAWQCRVLSNATETTLALPSPLNPGWHTLHLDAVDPGVVVDKIVIDFGGLHPSYDGPSETRLPKNDSKDVASQQ